MNLKICPKCGQENLQDMPFCAMCGNQLRRDEETLERTSISDDNFKMLTPLYLEQGMVFKDQCLVRYTGDAEELVVPDGVVGIGESVFCDNTTLRSVTLPSGLTSIGDYAFSGCVNLESVTLPWELTSIGVGAFESCVKLASVSLPGSLKVLGDNAFAYCTLLPTAKYDTAVYFGNAENPYMVLMGPINENILECSIHRNTRFIHSGAFRDVGVMSVSIPESVISIGEGAFEGCNMQEIYIPSGVRYIGSSAFEVKRATVPTTLVSGLMHIEELIVNGGDAIPERALYSLEGNDTLRKLTIGPTVKRVGASAFAGCVALESVTMYGGVEQVDADAFSGCKALTAVYYGATIADWCRIRFAAGANPLVNAHQLYMRNKLVTDLTFPADVIAVEANAFVGCTCITDVHYEGSLSDWCRIRFGNPDALPTRAGANLHVEGQLLTAISIPEDVTEVLDYAFYGVKSLTAVTLPATVTRVGTQAFVETEVRDVAYLGDLDGWLRVRFGSGSDQRRVFGRQHRLSIAGEVPSDIVIPDTIDTLGYRAFSGCTNITSVTISPAVHTVEAFALGTCVNMKNVYIPDSVHTLAEHVFYNDDEVIVSSQSAQAPTGWVKDWDVCGHKKDKGVAKRIHVRWNVKPKEKK